MLKLCHIAKQFPRQPHPVLADVSLRLEPGESVSIRGASGCGKSSLLHIIAGFDKPDSGEVWFQQQCLSSASVATADRFRREQLGMLFQAFNLLDALNVYDNMAFSARLKGNYCPQRHEQLAEQLGIAHLQQQAVHQLSGGEQQRVALGRALLTSPALVLADEPTGNLDEHTSEQVASLLYQHCKTHAAALIVVTHSQEIARGADHHYRLQQGMLVTDAP